MVVVRLACGFGNQMFQYALGRHLAHRRGDCLRLDTSLLKRPGTVPRGYELAMFNIDAQLTSMDQIARESPVFVTITQGERGFYEDVLRRVAHKSIILEGFWQSERYFQDIAPTIRADFTFRDRAYAFTCPGLPRAIQSSNAIAVHVRRGDVASSPTHHMGFVGLDYYQRAVGWILAHVERPHFFVFSDDIEWCVANLRIEHPHTFVRAPADGATEHDFRLMTLCRHFIIANSSYSWWAAWLGTRNGSVVAPVNWYNPDGVGPTWYSADGFVRPSRTDAQDLIPPRWMRL